jgi:superfamily II DNA/RNA helicase
LTSELSQNERIGVLNCFKKTPNCILVSTDVASRGIDIKDIDLVINYGFPNVTTDFIHRIGRTGRGGKLGKSITYIFQICKRIH